MNYSSLSSILLLTIFIIILYFLYTFKVFSFNYNDYDNYGNYDDYNYLNIKESFVPVINRYYNKNIGRPIRNTKSKYVKIFNSYKRKIYNIFR